MGDVSGRLGEFVEEMVKPAAVRLFRDRGLDVHQVSKNLVAYSDSGQFESEIDLLVVNKATAIAIECKSKLSIDDVKEHLERLDRFKQHFPQYGDYQVLGAVAAMVIPDEVGRYAYQKGLFVMAQNGQAILIKNDGKFNPKMW
jgi:RecB family endonuclease NucS